MSLYLENAIFKNVAPTGHLELDLRQNDVVFLSSINGKGKTTILSYIADSFFEIAKKGQYKDILKDSNKYYRLTSWSGISEGAGYSLVYLRYKDGDSQIDYLEVVGEISQEDYSKSVGLELPIGFGELGGILSEKGGKYVRVSQADAQQAFEHNVLVYFPADRLEAPVWLNDTELREYRFNTKAKFNHYLGKNIEVHSVSPKVANWILDVVLDFTVYKDEEIRGKFHQGLYAGLQEVLNIILSAKTASCRFGIGDRARGEGRITIIDNKTNQTLSPSIFHLSSGEMALLMIFAEILRQYDTYPVNRVEFNFNDVSGIVLVDEIEKHLHIDMQRGALPSLIRLFPNIQFITSNHAPFVSLGAEEKIPQRARVIDLSAGGIDIPAENLADWRKIYDQIISKNENYKELYTQLNQESVKAKKLRILTEGHNTQYVSKAIEILAPDLVSSVHICEGSEGELGDTNLKAIFQTFQKTGAFNKTLFVWDCDSEKLIEHLSDDNQTKKFVFTKNNANKKVKVGIENLFSPKLISKKRHYSTKTQTDNYGATKKYEEFNKNKFREEMLANASVQTFKNFEPLISKIREAVA